jgi:hypothetical protein
MKNLSIFVASFMLSACGEQPQGVWPTEVAHHIAAYSELSTTKPIGLIVEFGALPDKIVGQCIRWTNGRKVVTLNPLYWGALDEETRFVIIAHELGHCLEGYEHRGALKNGYITSLMNVYLLPLNMYQSRKQYYHSEFMSKVWEGS